MAGAGKTAIVATLMFALLLSASMADAARPVIEQGSNVAADGRTLVREGRQLRTFGCWFWNCGYHWNYGFFGRRFGFGGGRFVDGRFVNGFNNGGDVRIRTDRRRLNFWLFDRKGGDRKFRGFWGRWWH